MKSNPFVTLLDSETGEVLVFAPLSKTRLNALVKGLQSGRYRGHNRLAVSLLGAGSLDSAPFSGVTKPLQHPTPTERQDMAHRYQDTQERGGSSVGFRFCPYLLRGNRIPLFMG
jgi:hypothetical protein